MHSGSFRRLQGKTQILNLGDSDFYRTRLTHSLEVGQIAGGLARQVKRSGHPVASYVPEISLIQAVGFTHDLGHPPFGHGGEVALNYCMRDNGGFEGNGHTLRIVSRLEHFSEKDGADLTRRSLLAALKYPAPFSKAANPELKPRLDPVPTSIRILDRESAKPPKAYFDAEVDVVDWVLEPLSVTDRDLFQQLEKVPGKHSSTKYKSFDCSLMDLADDIAYGVHDLEDAIALDLIKEGEFRAAVPEEVCPGLLEVVTRKDKEKVGNNAYDYFILDLMSELKLYGMRLRSRDLLCLIELVRACRVRHGFNGTDMTQ